MKNRKTSKRVVRKTTRTNSKTNNGIQTLPSGKLRVRKMINGYEHDCTFNKYRDAVAYRNSLK